MITVLDLVDGVGIGLLQVVEPGPGAVVGDITLAEPAHAIVAQPGDLVLGVGVSGAGQAGELVERCAAAGAAGVVLRAPLSSAPQVRAAAGREGIALVELPPHASWAHVVWLLRGVIDRAATPESPLSGETGVHGDLFALADAAAAIVDAPVTIEDAQSRVLAYSSRQDETDPVRVSTIVGRRVPEEVIAYFRARGVFRALARSDEPIMVAAGPDGTLPRLVIPVRAGGEWLGSIWAVVATPVPAERVAELSHAATVLALHLLRLRAQAGAARRVSTDRLRAALRSAAPEAESRGWLPDGPWRVVALGAPGTAEDARRQLDLWESVARRFAWHQPLLADLHGLPLALVTEVAASRGGRRLVAPPGSWPWLRRVVAEVHAHDGSLYAAAGGLALERSDLPRSRTEAAELGQLLSAGKVSGPTVQLEEGWDAVVVERARTATRVDSGLLGGPLPALAAHDATHGTAYLATLAAWLEHHGEPRQAAKALHVHPNTLRYRMARIAEVAPLETSSPRVRLALQLQLGALLDVVERSA